MSIKWALLISRNRAGRKTCQDRATKNGKKQNVFNDSELDDHVRAGDDIKSTFRSFEKHV